MNKTGYNLATPLYRAKLAGSLSEPTTYQSSLNGYIMTISILLSAVIAVIITLGIAPESHAQCDNTIPMYGKNCIKSKELIEIDQKFIETTLGLYGNRENACSEHINFGYQHLLGGRDPVQAIKRFNQAWLLQPENPNVYYSFGTILEFFGKRDSIAAKEFYQLGMSKSKAHGGVANFKPHAALLQYFENNRDLLTASLVCTRVISLDPAALDGFFLKKRGFYMMLLKNYAKSEADLRRAILIDPNDATTYYNLGSLFTEQNQISKAKLEVERSLVIDPKYLSALAWLFHYHWNDNKNQEQALVIINQIIANEPTPEAFEKKAEILFFQSKPNEACDCLKQSMKMGHSQNKKLYQNMCKKKN